MYQGMTRYPPKTIRDEYGRIKSPDKNTRGGHSVCNACGMDMQYWHVVCIDCWHTFCYDCAESKNGYWYYPGCYTKREKKVLSRFWGN